LWFETGLMKFVLEMGLKSSLRGESLTGEVFPLKCEFVAEFVVEMFSEFVKKIGRFIGEFASAGFTREFEFVFIGECTGELNDF